MKEVHVPEVSGRGEVCHAQHTGMETFVLPAAYRERPGNRPHKE